MLTYGQLLKKLQDLNPLELEEDVVVIRENGNVVKELTTIFGLTDFRVATNYLVIGEFINKYPYRCPRGYLYDKDNERSN